MISMNHITSSSDAAGYYDKAFSVEGRSQADGYYINEQAAAVWQGEGAHLLGLEGQVVSREDFVNFLEGRLPHPSSGVEQDLSDNSRGDSRRLGYDLTVAPPKSVSIAGLVGGNSDFIDAHNAANARAMQWLEANSSFIRTIDSATGERSASIAGNFLYAAVQHETNRDNQPHLHTHNVIVSAVFDKDADKWRSLSNDQLLSLRKAADVVYKNELVSELGKRGIAVTWHSNGVDFEVKGFSRDVIEAFSRTPAINTFLKEQGIDPNTANFHERQTATLATRQQKNDQPRDALSEAWVRLGKEHGIDVDRLIQAARDNANTLTRDDASEKERTITSILWAMSHLSEREQAFSRTELEVASIQFGHHSIDHIEWGVNQLVAQGSLIERGTSLSDGRVFTTPNAVSLEREFVSHINEGKDRGLVVFNSIHEFDDALARFESKKSLEKGVDFRLTKEQVSAAQNILMHTDRYQGIQGDAGTGKTAVLEFVRSAAEEKGWRVVGMATTANAAQSLGNSTGIESVTVARFLADRATAIQLAQRELATLSESLGKHEVSSHSQRERLETHTINGVRYTFDSNNDTVFKSPADLRNKLGHFLITHAKANMADLSKDSNATTSSLKDRIALSIGKGLATFEKVEGVEAIHARTALAVHQDHAKGLLQFQIGVKSAEISNLQRTANRHGNPTLIVLDEASMAGIKDVVAISRVAQELNARTIIQGDIKQHGSVPAGRVLYQALEAGMNRSVLTETRRFDNATTEAKQAVALLNQRDFGAAMARLNSITVNDDDFNTKVAERYVDNLRELENKGVTSPNIGIVTNTNLDRKNLNAAVHNQLALDGRLGSQSFVKMHFDDPKLTAAQRLHSNIIRAHNVTHLVYHKPYEEVGITKKGEVLAIVEFTPGNIMTLENADGRRVTVNLKQHDMFSAVREESRAYRVGDQIEARANIEFGNKTPNIPNGSRGVITHVDEKGGKVAWVVSTHENVRETALSNDQFRFIDHGYARTTFKEQGATTDREIIAISSNGAKAFNSEAAYVAGTRGRDNSEIVTTDLPTLLKNAARSPTKTTAIDVRKDHEVAPTQANTVLDKEVTAATDRDVGKSVEKSKDSSIQLSM